MYLDQFDAADSSLDEDLSLAKTNDAGADAARVRVIEHCGAIFARAVTVLGLRGEAVADAKQAAAEAILGLIKTFDPTRGVAFKTYAYNYILGAARDGAFEGLPRPSRSADRDDPEASNDGAVMTFSSWYGRQVNADGRDDGDAREIFDANPVIGLSEIADAETIILAAEERREVRSAFLQLPPKRRDLVREIVIDGRSHAEAARKRGVSRPAVSQQLAVAVGQLRQIVLVTQEAA